MVEGLDRLLAAQGGVVTAAQALTLLTRRGLETQLKCGALQRVWHGIYSRDNPDHRRGCQASARPARP